MSFKQSMNVCKAVGGKNLPVKFEQISEDLNTDAGASSGDASGIGTSLQHFT